MCIGRCWCRPRGAPLMITEFANPRLLICSSELSPWAEKEDRRYAAPNGDKPLPPKKVFRKTQSDICNLKSDMV